MPKTRPPYAPEFRRQMVELVRAGRDPAELCPGVRTDRAVDQLARRSWAAAFISAGEG